MSLNKLRDEVYQNAVFHGFHDETRSFLECMALIHSEASEAVEEYRNGLQPNFTWYESNSTKPLGIPSELADIIIRVLDTCGQYGINIEAMVEEKMRYNKTRPHKHGKVI